MRIVLILFLIFITALADDKTEKVTIGAGPYIQSQPYYSVDDILIPSPVIFYDNGLFYIRWSQVGIYFLGNKEKDYAWGFSLALQPRPYGYESGDSATLSGMNDRESSWEGGLSFGGKIGKSYLEVMALADILDRYDSWILKTEIGHDFKLGEFSLYPSIIAIYQSSKFINYYYGVTDMEATGDRKAYTPNAGLLIGAQTYIKYPFTNKFSMLINIRADRLSSQATRSPIVKEKHIYSGLLSLIYTFQY